MGLTATYEGGEDFVIEPVPAGLQCAICYQVIDLGHQHNKMFDKWQPKVMLVFELPKVIFEHPEKGFLPKAISREFTVSLHPKGHLSPFLTGWFSKSFDEGSVVPLEKLAGQHAMLNVVHVTKGDKTYANIASAAPATEECQQLQLNNDVVVYELGKGQPIPETVPEWIKIKIMNSREWNEQGQQNTPQGYDKPQDPIAANKGDAPF